MGELIRLDGPLVDSAREFLNEVASGEITAGAMVYATEDGEMCWRTFGHEDMHRIVGMLFRLATGLADGTLWE